MRYSRAGIVQGYTRKVSIQPDISKARLYKIKIDLHRLRRTDNTVPVNTTQHG